MRELFTAAVISASMVLASTSAAAASRPAATRFTQPVAVNPSEGRGSGLLAILIGVGGVVGLLALVSRGNSPNN